METIQRTAYMLQVHKNPGQINKFIKQLISDDQADVYIHIDKRNYDNVHGEILKSPRVKVLKQNIVCEWADISQVATTLLLLREVLASGKKYDYVCLRSGQDLLIKDGFKDFLLENNGKIFMGFREITKKDLHGVEINWPKVTRRRINSVHPYRILRRIIFSLYQKGINCFPNKNFWPKEYSFYTGSQWITIPYEVACYIMKFINENDWYYKFFECTMAPDEWFFHTLIMNSPYKTDVVKDNLTYIEWGVTYKDRESPLIITSKDIETIEKTNHFFARKFDMGIDQSVIDYFVKKVRFGSRAIVNTKRVSNKVSL